MEPIQGQISFHAARKAVNHMNESSGGMAIAAKSQPREGGYYRWAEPNSDITVCLKTEMVDRLQIDALRGIVSSPHAGKEVGGILLGRTETNNAGVLTFVEDFAPFPCAHRNGPFYDLTAAEAAGFEAMLAQGRTEWEQSVVGYYRSHDRDGLFLSPADLQLIERHFPAQDNIFLIIKTLPNRACTAGFFFWKNGRIQSEFTDSEAPLIPISLPAVLGDPVPAAAVAPVDDDPLVPVMTEFTRRRTFRRRLIRGIAITGVAAAATIAVIRYRAPRPVHSEPAPESTPVARGTVPPTPDRAEPAFSRKPLEPSPDPPEMKPAIANAQPRAKLPADAAANSTAPIPTPVPETDTEPPRPAADAVSLPAEKAPAAFTDPPLNPVPAPTSPETAIAPPPAVTPSPFAAAPLTPATSPTGPPANSAPPANAETSSSPSPAPPKPIYTRVGPQVINTPLAVPRRVGPKLTTDVEVDVEVGIDVKGKVTRARVVSTKGAAAGLLAIEALKAAQLFRFQPAQENGLSVASVMVLTFRFDQIPK